MKKTLLVEVICTLLIAACGALAAEPPASANLLRWVELPQPEGIEPSFMGSSNGVLIIAGDQANDAGRQRVLVLRSPGDSWQPAEIPPDTIRPNATSITTNRGIVCVGGSDGARHYADSLLMRWSGDRVEITHLPPLPVPLAGGCGAAAGDIVYVAGGLESPRSTAALKRFFVLDLSQQARGWKELDPWPGEGRLDAIAAVWENSFFLVGGRRIRPDDPDNPVRQPLRDAFAFAPGDGWKRVADLPHAVAAAPTPAPAVGPAHFVVIGGGGEGRADTSSNELANRVLTYHALTNTWLSIGSAPFVATAARAAVPWAGGFVIAGSGGLSGERSSTLHLVSATAVRQGFGWLNYTALIVYLLAMVGIGLWFTRRERSTDQFFRGGQRIPWWAAGLSIYATMLSSLSYMAIPAKAYATDWGFFMNGVAIVLVAPLVIFAYLPFYRQLDVTSAYEYLERRFNVAVRLLGSGAFMLLQVGRMAIVLYLPALALATVSTFDIYTCIVLMGVLCIIYTVFGGIEAVIWTDAVQSVVLFGGALLALAMIVVRLDGGIGELFHVANGNAKFFQTVSWRWDTAAATASIVLVGSMFGNLVSYTASQDVVQRYVTTKDKKRAAQSIWMNAAISLPSSALFFFVGTALFVFYKTHPQRLDPTLPTDAIFPQFMVRELPVGIAGLVVAGIFAAAQSTLSSSLNSVATAYVTDFHRRFHPQVSDRAALRLAQWITVALGGIAVGVACVMASRNVASLWDLFVRILGLTGGGLAGLFALGIFTRRAHGIGALIGAFVSTIALYYVQRYTQVNFFLFAAVGIVVCFVVGYAASLVLPFQQKPLDGLTIFTARMAAEDEVAAGSAPRTGATAVEA